MLSFALEGVSAPMLIVFLVCGAALRFGLPRLAPIGLALACLAPCLLAYPPELPPARLLDYLPVFGLAAFLLFLPFDLKDLPGIFPLAVRWLFVLFASWFMLRHKIDALQDISENLALIVLLWATTWTYIDSASKTRKGGMLMLAIAAFGGGITLYFGSSATLGLMSTGIGTALASWLILSGLSAEMKPGRSGLAMAVTLFACLMLIGTYYSGIPRGAAILLLSVFASDLLIRTVVQIKPDITSRGAAELTAAVALVPVAILAWLSIGSYFQGG